VSTQPAALLRISRARLLLVLAVVCYVTIFNVTYRDIISPTFAFWGLGYNPPPPFYFWTSAVLCVVPSLWMPLTFSRPTLLLFYMQYLLIFVPASFVAYHSTRPELRLDDALWLVVAMFAGLTIVQASFLVPVRQSRFIRLTPPAFWVIFATIAAIMLLYVVRTFAGNFRLANFVDIYSVRFAMSEIASSTGTRFGVYAQSLLLALFLPISFAVGAFSRRWWMIITTGIVYVFLFGIGGAKSAILALIYLPLVYGLLSQPRARIPLLMIAGLSAVLLSGYVSSALLSSQTNISYLGVVHFRLFTVPALTLPQYADFFQTHPVTHLSHVTGFNWFLRYPYDLDIAYTIGWYYYGSALGANSGFWGTDGIAGFGLWGIPLISGVCAFVFLLADSIAADVDPAFAGVALAYSAVFFTNVSLFTTLITGGLAFVIFALAVAPRDKLGRIALTSVPRLRTSTAVVNR